MHSFLLLPFYDAGVRSDHPLLLLQHRDPQRREESLGAIPDQSAGCGRERHMRRRVTESIRAELCVPVPLRGGKRHSPRKERNTEVRMRKYSTEVTDPRSRNLSVFGAFQATLQLERQPA